MSKRLHLAFTLIFVLTLAGNCFAVTWNDGGADHLWSTGDVWSFTTADGGGPSSLSWDDGGSGHLWSSPYNWTGDEFLPGPVTGLGIRVKREAGDPNFGPVIDSSVAALSEIVRFYGPDTGAETVLTMTGGTYDAFSHVIVERGGCVIEMSGGVANMYSLWVGNMEGWNAGQIGKFHMTGGILNITGGSLFVSREPLTGSLGVQLDGGTINAPSLYMGAGYMDIAGGTLILNDNKTGQIDTYEGYGWITAYSGAGTIIVDYDNINPGKTTVTATSFKACHPNPADGQVGVVPDANLSWQPGIGITTYDVYFDTVNPPVTKVSTAQAGTTFNPPGDLAMGTTYYWRIDGDGGSVTGDVWSFTTYRYEAYNPVPVDGAINVPVGTMLDWSAGDGAVSHDVYIGTSFSAVDDANTNDAECVSIEQVNSDYTPGSQLEMIVTYYWRVDDHDVGDVVTKGYVWEFTTASVPGDCASDLGTGILDGKVDLYDIQTLANEWLQETFEGEDYLGSDINYDRISNFEDFAIMAGSYNVDILIEDFEDGNYNGWDVTGSAFGPGPAQGTQPGQGGVTGYEGDGLVNTFYTSDVNTGTLTSSSQFEIERKYLNFLIGGGNHPNETCINLIVDEEVVETATGLNDEALKWKSWDLSELQGEMAELQIVDNHTGGWGHINIDYIVQSSKKLDSDYIMEVEITKRYLNFPVQHGVDDRLMKVIIDGNSVREFVIELADGTADYWVFLDVSEFTGKNVVLQAPRYYEDNTEMLREVTHDDEITGHESIYNEALRGQFHFSSKRGWNNDTNGMVYYNGLYHMFYQHNPYGCSWGNMTWGHAVSTDMVHWTEWPDAIHPDEMGTIFSGSAVVDSNDTAGFKTGTESPIVCFYTSAGGTNSWSQGAGFTQSIAYSNDGGKTFTKYQDNPVIEQIVAGNRDPKVFWYEPTDKWVMVLFTDTNEFAIYDSSNLKEWTETSTITPFYECPELFELPVDGNESNTKWVLYGANGNYTIGAFDGNEFDPETELLKFDYGNTFYASQTFNNEPNGRRVQMAWGRVDTPNMPFNQCVMFPVELTLHSDSNSILMFANPIDEIESLYVDTNSWYNETIYPEDDLLDGYAGDLWDIEAVFDVTEAETVGFDIRGAQIIYDVDDEQLTCAGFIPADVSPQDGKIHLRVIVDVATIEVFANEGEIYMAMKTVDVDRDDWSIGVFTTGGSSELEYLHVRELESIWP